MSEGVLQLIAFLKLIVVAFIALLYGLGGMKGKWKRRYVASFIIVAAICLFSLWEGTFSLWYLLSYPLYIGAFSIGYGAQSVGDKLIKRSRYAAAIAIASLPIAIVNAAWLMWGVHLGVCLLVIVPFGVWNPTYARNEETIFGAVSALLPLYMI